jgi:hypothetical protein
MRRLALVVGGLIVISLQATRAQTPARPVAARAPATQAAPAPDALPVRRVILYKNGIGYFEHLGRVRASQAVTVDFNSTQLDDVLKTLTVLDLGGGRVTGVSYNSEAPLAQRLGSLRLQVGEHATLTQLLDALRGARLEVHASGGLIVGRLLGVESRTRMHGGETTTLDEITLVSDDGQIRIVEVTPAVTVKLAQRESAEQVDTFLGLLASTRSQDRRRMTIATAGTGDRDLLVSYISEVPIWKTTYRIVLPSGAGPTTLQGWAIVDNTIGEDWRNVQLSLVAGAPQSFIQQLSQPMYARRPVVPLSPSLLPTPQLHQATLESGTGGVYGEVTDASGAALPGATVKVLDETDRVSAQAIADARGRYTVAGLTPGTYTVTFELAGFQASRDEDVEVGPGEQTQSSRSLSIGSLSETVTVAGAQPARRKMAGVVGGVTGGIVAAPPSMPSRDAIENRAASIEPVAQGRDLGDLFEYRIDAPISIGRNRSALVPILRADVAADRVSLWNGRTTGGRPLRSLWLTNSSSLTLDSGSFTVLDAGSFAGEGLVDALKPGEKRLLSYAVDLGVQVEPRNGDEQRTVTRISIAHGVLVEHSEHVAQRVYTIRNSDTSNRRVVIEHPLRAGWKLTGAVTPAETSAEAYRFLVNVPSTQTEKLTVVEQQPLDTTYRVTDITDQQVALFVRESGNDETLRTMLAPVVAAKAAAAAIGLELASRAAEMKRIGDDQQRIRENMKALKGSSEEQQLTKRYAAQLTQQEDRVEALKKESAELEGRRREAQAELARRIESLVADITVKPAASRLDLQ